MIIKDAQNQIAQDLKAGGIETAVLDARVLMMHVLDVSLEELLIRRSEDFPVTLQSQLDDCVKKRLNHMPIAKITGMKEFWGLPFKTSVDTLDPRPDSETLIEAVLENCIDRQKPYRILDLGTGTGCLLISLLCELPNATGLGVDASIPALNLARENGVKLDMMDRSDWIISDWFSHVTGQFDIIVSNPPYIPSGDIEGLAKDVRQFDPLSALDGGVDGLMPYHIIAEQVASFLSKNGIIALEYGQGQAPEITKIFTDKILLKPTIYKDLGGIERVIIFKN